MRGDPSIVWIATWWSRCGCGWMSPTGSDGRGVGTRRAALVAAYEHAKASGPKHYIFRLTRSFTFPTRGEA